MKKIEALIPAFEVEVVADALRQQGVEDLILSEVLQSAPSQPRTYRGASYSVDYVPEVKLETVVSDAAVTSTARCIADALRTGRCQDAAILVAPVEAVIEIGGREYDALPTLNHGVPRPSAWAETFGEASHAL